MEEIEAELMNNFKFAGMTISHTMIRKKIITINNVGVGFYFPVPALLLPQRFRTISGNSRQFNYRDESAGVCMSAH